MPQVNFRFSVLITQQTKRGFIPSLFVCDNFRFSVSTSHTMFRNHTIAVIISLKFRFSCRTQVTMVKLKTIVGLLRAAYAHFSFLYLQQKRKARSLCLASLPRQSPSIPKYSHSISLSSMNPLCSAASICLASSGVTFV